MAKKLINTLMKVRVHVPTDSIEIRNEAWDYVSEDGVIFGYLSN